MCVSVLAQHTLRLIHIHQWEVFTGSTEDPKYPQQTATICYGAAVFYAALTAFCAFQVSLRLPSLEGVKLMRMAAWST